jgi:hypothetical protein
VQYQAYRRVVRIKKRRDVRAADGCGVDGSRDRDGQRRPLACPERASDGRSRALGLNLLRQRNDPFLTTVCQRHNIFVLDGAEDEVA